MLPLSTFIHRKFVILRQNATVFQAARAMCENQIGCLLITNAEGRAVGILTDRDLACSRTQEFIGKDIPVQEIMSHELIAAREEDHLSEVIDLMEQHGIRRIPIIRDDQRFVGMITLDDLIAAKQIDRHRLSRIICRQLGRRVAYLTEHHPTTARALQRSETHKKQALNRFYAHLSRTTALELDLLPRITHFILGTLIMRIPYTGAAHLLAQLPEHLRTPLLRLPPGPDRSYTSQRILSDLSSRFHLTEGQAKDLFRHFIFSLKTLLGPTPMEHLQGQLPQDFQPYFTLMHTSICFSNRIEAAQNLVQKLQHYEKKNPLILAIPRGAVPMAKIIAEQLHGELDVVLVHKVGDPNQPELAIGSVSEFGTIYSATSPISNFEFLAKDEIEKLRQKRRTYSPIRPAISPQDRTVMIIDDGIATGATMLAAIRAIRPQGPQRIIVASPVASPSAMRTISKEADEVMILETPEDFFSISQFYEDFSPVNDSEVIEILKSSASAKAA